MSSSRPAAPKPTRPAQQAAKTATAADAASAATPRGGTVLQHPVTQPQQVRAAGDGAGDGDEPSSAVLGPAWGAVLGHAGTWLAALARSSLTEREKALATTLFLRTYGHRSKHEWQQAATAAAEGARPFWQVRLDGRELCVELECSPSNLSEWLDRLARGGVIARDQGGLPYVWLRHPDTWAPAIRSRRVARELHTREGAGAPAYLTADDPLAALVGREVDKAGRPLMTMSDLYLILAPLMSGADGGASVSTTDTPSDPSAPAPLTPTQIQAHWQVILHFQSLHQQSFQARWVGQLTKLLLEERITPGVLCATLAEHKRTYRPRAPWGYLVTAIYEAQASEARASAPVTASRGGRAGLPPRMSRTTDTDSNNEKAGPDHDQQQKAGRGRHGEFARFFDDDDDDDEPAAKPAPEQQPEPKQRRAAGGRGA